MGRRGTRVAAMLSCLVAGLAGGAVLSVEAGCCPRPDDTEPGTYIIETSHGRLIDEVPFQDGTATLTEGSLVVEYTLEDERTYRAVFNRLDDD